MNSEQLPTFEARSNYVNPRIPCRTVRALEPDESPCRGAHLITPWFGIAHHGIYVGDGKVVHYGALMYDIIRKPVEEVTLAQFAEGRPVFVVEHGEECVATDEAIRRARSRLGEKRYRLLSNNCEHFVEWCLHGVHRSFQAETALAYPRMLSEWIEGAVLGFLRRTFSRAAGTRATPIRVPAAVCVREPSGRNDRSRARTRTDIDSPCS
jgi:Lecithin retinol acyltransferase